jgi:hypothetical protein
MLAVARALDERANLRESLSTALCVARSEDPWAKVVVETARQRAVSVKVGQAIPIAAPRLWPVPFASALVLAILWFSVPRLDVLGIFSKRDAARKQEEQRIEAVNEVKADEKALEEKLKQAKVDLKDEKAEADAAENKPTTPDEIRRLAVKKLTAATEKLSEKMNSEKAQQLQALKQAMKQIKQPGPGPMEELAKSLQQGNFQKAEQDLQELSKKMASSEMSPEDKQKAAEQMKKLADQLAKLAEKKEDIQKKLEQAGMSKEAAKQASENADALKKAMDQLQNMSEDQKKELMKQMQSQMGACKQCQGMSESMSKMAKGASKSGMNQEGQEGMDAMSGQLSEAEMMSKECESMDAAMSEAMKQLSKMASKCNGNCDADGDLQMKLCESPWKAGQTNKKGGGRGGPGQSGGSGAGKEQEAAVNISKTMSPTKQGQGPIVGTRLVQGEQVKGESVAEFQAAVESSAKAATEAVENQQVPRELQDSVKGYFGRLEKRVKPTSAGDAPAAPAAEPKTK